MQTSQWDNTRKNERPGQGHAYNTPLLPEYLSPSGTFSLTKPGPPSFEVRILITPTMNALDREQGKVLITPSTSYEVFLLTVSEYYT